MEYLNRWEAIKYFYDMRRDAILAAPRNEWAIDPYEWERFMTLTPIEYWLWGDIREANAVMYPQWPVGGIFVDFANPVAKVAIECDGAAFHQDKAKDEARDEKLRSMGWRVYRLTGSECRTEADEETGEFGYARMFIEDIAYVHGLKRTNAPKSTDMYGMVCGLVDHLFEVNQA